MKLVPRTRSHEVEWPAPGTPAAYLARFSNDGNLVDADQSSVARQGDFARQLADRQQWPMVEAFVDDGISGAEFQNRPDFMRLMNMLDGGRVPPFQVLIMSELSRLGRELFEVPVAIKRLSEAGVRIFTYRDGGRELRVDTPTEKMMLMFNAFTDDMEAFKARQRSFDATARLARQGFAIGKAAYGYTREAITVKGRKSHSEFHVDPEAAEVVRRIFRRTVEGAGAWRIAAELNTDGIAAPQIGRWGGGSIRQILKNPIYRGEMEWHRVHVRDAWGKKIQGPGSSARKRIPREEWERIAVPHLRIVDDVTWYAVHKRYERIAADAVGRKRPGRSRDGNSAYRLSGHVWCGVCGGRLGVRGKGRGSADRVYACASYSLHGTRACANGRKIATTSLERAVIAAVVAAIMRPTFARDLIETVRGALTPPTAGATARRGKDLARLERESRSLAEQLARGRRVEAISAALQTRQAQIDALRAAVAADTSRAYAMSDAEIARRVNQAIEAGAATLMSDDVVEGRAQLAVILREPVRVRPAAEGGVEFEGAINTRALTGVAGVPSNDYSPTGKTVKGNGAGVVVFRGKAA